MITGASSGLGSIYAKLIDGRKDIDEIWLIARREDKLFELSSSLEHRTNILPLDLTKPASIDRLESALKAKAERSSLYDLSSADEKKDESGITVAFLVNCAGVGKIGK